MKVAAGQRKFVARTEREQKNVEERHKMLKNEAVKKAKINNKNILLNSIVVKFFHF